MHGTVNRTPTPGEPAPWFTARCASKTEIRIDAYAGRYVVLCFYASCDDPLGRDVVQGLVSKCAAISAVQQVSFFGISIDPKDESEKRIPEKKAGICFLWDFNCEISRQYSRLNGHHYEQRTIILDERLRFYALVPFGDNAYTHVDTVTSILTNAPQPGYSLGSNMSAPILGVPGVFEPALCQRLIDYYNQGGSTDSGFMRDVAGKTVGIIDHHYKLRSDKQIADKALRDICTDRIYRRVVPEILRAFQFEATRMERHVVACYDGAVGGHFRSHRDNRTNGTAHRRFAVSVALNSGEFSGGLLKFPEYGDQTYCALAGGALVFSCSLLHEVTPVTQGVRYVYLPFLYDEAAALIRSNNLHLLEPHEGGRSS